MTFFPPSSVHMLRCQNFACLVKRMFKTLPVSVDKSSAEFKTNVKHFARKKEYFKQATAIACSGGGQKVIDSHRKRNKMLADERLHNVLDKNADFLELSTLAGLGMDYGNVPRAGIITGIGKVHGIHCMFIVNDSTVKGGTMYPIGVTKQLRAHDIAIENRLPCIYITDSGGAFLPLQSEIFPGREHGGRTFYNEAILSSMGVPQVAVVCGNCTAGGAYVPTMSQEAIIVHKTGTIFLGGPPLVYAALGEVVSAEELGGATLHCRESGGTDYFSATELEAYEMCKQVVETFNMQGPTEHDNYEEPVYDLDDLEGLIPHADLHTLDVKQVIARITDGSKFHEFKEMYGTGLITGFAHIKGYLVGILANQGELCGKSATKGAHFVQLCDQRNIPVVFLQNTHPVEKYSADIDVALKCQAQMISTVATAKVPKFTVKIGSDGDHSSYAMCGRALGANFVFSWPNVKSYNVNKEAMLSAFIQKQFPKGYDENSEIYMKFIQKVGPLVEHKASSLYGSSLMKDDGVIMPQQTRNMLGMCLSITSQPAPGSRLQQGVLRM